MKTMTLLAVVALLACNVSAAADETTVHPGLFFTIKNDCGSPVSGFAVGDKICLLQVGSATYTRAIFQGTMVSGEEKFSMACTGEEGDARVLFVPPVSSGAQAVEVRVQPDQVVSIPETFCGAAAEAPESQFMGE